MERVHRWRIFLVSDPAQTTAEVVFRQETEDGAGSTEILAENPAMRALLTYYLVDPFDHRPQHFPETGTLSGPHMHYAGQVHRQLMRLNREFPAYDAARMHEDPASS
ncbi:MAG: hypothetical protein ACT4O1_12830 [Gemmatimonadota bacterium]